MADRHRGAERLIEEGVDLIAAGFPCQDISFAGEGAGLAGTRSGLVWDLLRTIRLVRPRRALLENVAALLGRGLDQICGHLAAVGYDTEWHCIPASAVGAPHQRDRIWIIATDAGSEQHEGGSAPLSGEIASELSRTFADATAMHGPTIIGDEPDRDTARVAEMAYAASDGRGSGRQGRPDPGSARQSELSLPPVGNANGARLAVGEGERGDTRSELSPSIGAGWWSAEPALDRVADGVPYRVDRLRGLGNAVVPQVPEVIGRAIMNAITMEKRQ